MRKGLPILMMITILAIAGFQVFWLRENYKKEKGNLELRTNIIFGETIRRLQAQKLNLDKIFNDTTGRIKIEMIKGEAARNIPTVVTEKEELAAVLNDITTKIKDSITRFAKNIKEPANVFVETNHPVDSVYLPALQADRMVISLSESSSKPGRDSAREIRFQRRGRPEEIFRFLYSVDSLQDSLTVTEIDSACRIAFKKEELNIAFSIKKTDSFFHPSEIHGESSGMLNKVRVGFANPVTWEMTLGNSFSYLTKKLASPILFSLFLVGISVLSFALLYRNLMRQKRLTEIKNEFIGNITHELKTPIATVGVAIEALRNFNAINDPQRTKEYLDISQNELQRLSLLVDKVLKLSMFEKKEIELKYEPLNMKEIVDEVVGSMKLQIEKHQAGVSVNTDGDTTLQGDKLHLLSVVFNLLDNALRYSNGRPEVKIEIEEKGNNVELSVADNGIGIAPEYKDRVFEKFFRVPAGNIHNTKGYGLGLSYVAHVVEKHKGKIETENLPGAGTGTKFTITLPKQQI